MLPVMLPRSAETDAFWQEFRPYAGLDHDNYVVGSFSDSPEMATELADLVRRSRLIGQLPGRKKLKTGSRLLVSRFPEIKFILSCCGVL